MQKAFVELATIVLRLGLGSPAMEGRRFVVGADGSSFARCALKTLRCSSGAVWLNLKSARHRENCCARRRRIRRSHQVVTRELPDFAGARGLHRSGETVEDSGFLIRRVFFARTGLRFVRKRYRQLLPGRLLINVMSILAGRRHLRASDRSIGHEDEPHA